MILRTLSTSLEQCNDVQSLSIVTEYQFPRLSVAQATNFDNGNLAINVAIFLTSYRIGLLAAANKIIKGGTLRLGWTKARMEMLSKRPTQCFKCLQKKARSGSVSKQYKQIKRMILLRCSAFSARS